MKIAMLSRPTDADSNYDTENNIGNLVFREAVHRQINHDVMFDWGEFDKIKESDAEVFVVPLANVIRSRYTFDEGFVESWVDAIGGRPLIGLGMGADAIYMDQPIQLSDNVKQWVESFTAIWTRGRHTTAILDSMGIDSVAGCCPSLFLNTVCPKYPRTMPHPSKVAGATAKGKPRALEAQATSISMAGGSIFVQGPDEYVSWCKLNEQWRIAKEVGCKADKVFFSFSLEEWVKELRKHDLLVSPRYHCAALAFASGVPTVCLPIDLRTEELCESTLIPTCTVGDEVRVPYFDEREFRENRLHLRLRYERFLAAYGIEFQYNPFKP